MRKVEASAKRSPRYTFQAQIMNLSKRSRAQLVRRVCEALEARYRHPRHGNPKNALDDLIYIILSNKTGPNMAASVYSELKQRFETWDDVVKRGNSVLERVLRPAGLSRIKSTQIRSALRQIRSDFGSCTLRRMAKLPTRDAQSYLTSLPGVSDKVAKCVLIYACGRQVLPVDGHVHRITRRLGWTVRKRADQCHCELESLVPPQRRYAFHVNCVAHGRLICRPSDPNCRDCCISRYCQYNRQRVE
jgi:endonuclease III